MLVSQNNVLIGCNLKKKEKKSCVLSTLRLNIKLSEIARMEFIFLKYHEFFRKLM